MAFTLQNENGEEKDGKTFFSLFKNSETTFSLIFIYTRKLVKFLIENFPLTCARSCCDNILLIISSRRGTVKEQCLHTHAISFICHFLFSLLLWLKQRVKDFNTKNMKRIFLYVNSTKKEGDFAHSFFLSCLNLSKTYDFLAV